MPTCKAIIQEGPRKGLQCTFELIDTPDQYCGRHHRNKEYDEGVVAGNRWCRFFFRGCSNTINDLPQNISSCKECRAKKKTNANCEHEDCKSQALNKEKFCGKHLRDKYRLEEIEKGITYCDIDRGCFNQCEKDKSSCTECLFKANLKTKKRFDERRNQNEILKHIDTNTRICVKCGKDFEKYSTTKKDEAQKCLNCFEIQLRAEVSRTKRSRNYKAERFTNLKSHYSMYINNSINRNKEIPLQFSEFCNIVVKPCYYCNYFKEDEVNGIDRINNDIGYELSNCVPCCELCNRMKSFYHPSFFIDKAKIMCGQIKAAPEFYEKWKIYYNRSINRTYSAYKSDTIKRDIPFNLTQEEFTSIIMQRCYLCGYKQRQGIGIDRFDNTIREYTLNNCKPCCASCNNAKFNYEYTTFIGHCAAIAKKWKDTSEFDHIPIPVNPYKHNTPIDKNLIIKQWRASSLYKAIMSENIIEYYEQNKDYVNMDELNTLSDKVKLLDESSGIEVLKTYLNTINKRRSRKTLEKEENVIVQTK